MSDGEVKRIKVYHLRETFCPRALLVDDKSPMPDHESFLIPVEDHDRLMKEKDAQIDSLRTVLEAVRSQMCWERDRDQLTMGMASLHDDVTKALEKGEA